MALAADLQALLRFLSQDAKVPLATSMGKVKKLQEAKLTSPEAIAKAKSSELQDVFEDDKVGKQVLNAAKRIAKKRAAGEDTSPAKKRTKPLPSDQSDPAEFERSLALPATCHDEELLSKTVLYTNRAPVVLAFALTLLKYTMPEQPISSRLSLAQALVSMNSRSKAVSLGIEDGKSAEDEGWGQGQPTVTVMGREIRVMKRWGYDWKSARQLAEEYSQASEGTIGTQQTLTHEVQPALWGIDLEALKKSNAGTKTQTRIPDSVSLPIYTAQSARSYLLKAFDTASENIETEVKAPKKTGPGKMAQKEHNLGLVFGALELLYDSWKDHIPSLELDKKSWAWYMQVRPVVENGVAGWGGKNTLKLSAILDLRRES